MRAGSWKRTNEALQLADTTEIGSYLSGVLSVEIDTF